MTGKGSDVARGGKHDDQLFDDEGRDELRGGAAVLPDQRATHDLRGASNGRATGEDDGYLKLVFDADQERESEREDADVDRRRAAQDRGDPPGGGTAAGRTRVPRR